MRRFGKGDRPEIEYPCTWGYTVIGSEEAALRAVVDALLVGREYTLRPSNRSSGGKYVSLVLELVVESEADRIAVFEGLRAEEAVAIVL